MASTAERLVWRLVNPEHAPGLDGEGARLWGGRWNSPGLPLVYAASSLALAVLESFVHLPPELRMPGMLPERMAVALRVPEDAIGRLDPAAIPPGAPPGWFRAEGDGWLGAGTALAREVPSAVVPPETNLLINPRHARMAEVRVERLIPFRFDPRMAA